MQTAYLDRLRSADTRPGAYVAIEKRGKKVATISSRCCGRRFEKWAVNKFGVCLECTYSGEK